MSKKPAQAGNFDVKFVMKTLFELQVAIAKLAVALYEKERKDGPLPMPTSVDEGDMPTFESAKGGRRLLNDIGGPPINDECGEPPVPPLCDPRALTLLCRNLAAITAYLRVLCRTVNQ